MSKEIDISELEWRFVWHGSGGKDLWNRRGGRICIGGANYNELLYVGENQFDLDNAESLIAKHNSDLLAVAQSKNAEIEKLKAENERLKASQARYETLRKLNVVQFQHLYTKALQSPIPFDELVDMLGETK